MLDAPENLEAIVIFATIAANIGEYKVAVDTLERLLLFSSNVATVHANLGFLYLQLGSPEIARSHLLDALNSGKLPPGFTDRTRRLIDAANGTLNRHQFGGAVNFEILVADDASNECTKPGLPPATWTISGISFSMKPSDVAVLSISRQRQRTVSYSRSWMSTTAGTGIISKNNCAPTLM